MRWCKDEYFPPINGCKYLANSLLNLLGSQCRSSLEHPMIFTDKVQTKLPNCWLVLWFKRPLKRANVVTNYANKDSSRRVSRIAALLLFRVDIAQGASLFTLSGCWECRRAVLTLCPSPPSPPQSRRTPSPHPSCSALAPRICSSSSTLTPYSGMDPSYWKRYVGFGALTTRIRLHYSITDWPLKVYWKDWNTLLA